jgi:ABC-2 type transport system permease protein
VSASAGSASLAPFAPAPGAAPLRRQIRAHARLELRLLLRQGEQVVLTLVLPVLLLVTFTAVAPEDVLPGAGAPIDILTPGVLALAVLSTAFTGQAISTGFDRRYGVLKRLGSTPLPRVGLLTAKVLAVLAIETIQLCVLAGVATALGWAPSVTARSVASVVGLVILGTAAFTALALLLAGTLRAEATLAVANLAYLVFLVTGGVFLSLDRFPDALAAVAAWTPLAALSSGLRLVLQGGAGPSPHDVGVLVAWAVVAGALAAWRFRWE